jgi:hypothetical protein
MIGTRTMADIQERVSRLEKGSEMTQELITRHTDECLEFKREVRHTLEKLSWTMAKWTGIVGAIVAISSFAGQYLFNRIVDRPATVDQKP